jgi:hypothetical protein
MLEFIVKIGFPLPIYIQFMFIFPFNITFLNLKVAVETLDSLIL